MSDAGDEDCVHSWGPAEKVELPLGTLWSPLCKHCGAVKLQEENRAHERRRTETMLRPVNAPIATNIPPASAPIVHGFQHEFFTDVGQRRAAQ